MIPKAQSMVCEVIQLIVYDLFISLITCFLIERQKHMAHGAVIYRKVRKPQADQLIYPLFYHIKVLLISCRFIGLRYAVISYTAGPVPGHIHVHGALCHFVYNRFKLSFIIVQFHFPFCTGQFCVYTSVFVHFNTVFSLFLSLYCSFIIYFVQICSPPFSDNSKKQKRSQYHI